MLGGAVGVAVYQGGATGLPKPVGGGLSVDVCPGIRSTELALAFLAALAQLAGHGGTLCQWLLQEIPLPARVAYLLAENHVVGVVKAQGVAVTEQPPLTGHLQPGGILQGLHAAGLQSLLTQQKVAIASHEPDRALLGVIGKQPGTGAPEMCCTGIDLRQPGGRRVGGNGVVADPDLEQVTQHDEGVGLTGQWTIQVGPQDSQCLRIVRVQVEVRDQVNRAPARRRPQDARLRLQLILHAGQTGNAVELQRATAFSMTTSSLGTSSWNPLRPVATPSIFLTMSVPPVTLPNTA